MIFLLASLLLSTLSEAETITLAGKKLECKAAKSISFDRTLRQSGVNFGGRIRLNPRLLEKKPNEVQWFVFYHECGHSIFTDEIKADAYAAEIGRAEGWLTDAAMDSICQSFQAPRAYFHPPRSERCQALKETISRIDQATKN